MFISLSFKKSLIVEQFQGNYLKLLYTASGIFVVNQSTVLQAQVFQKLATSLCKMVATTINLVAKIKSISKKDTLCPFLHWVSTADQNEPTLKSFEEHSNNVRFCFQQFFLFNSLIYRKKESI